MFALVARRMSLAVLIIILLTMIEIMGHQAFGAGFRITGIDPGTAYWGDTVRIYGTGANPNNNVVAFIIDNSTEPMYLANTLSPEVATSDTGAISLGIAHAQASGDWEVSIVVPLAYPGAYPINVFDNGSLTSESIGLNILTKPIPPFAIDGLSPSFGLPGTQVYLSCFGACYEGLNVLFDGAVIAQATRLREFGLGSDIWDANFSIPYVPLGNHTLALVDVFSGGNRSVEFTVGIIPVLTLPDEGAAGSEFTIYGQNFQALEPVNIMFEDSLLASTYTDNTGAFNVEVFVPMVNSGKYTITADNMSNIAGQWQAIASAPFTVTAGIDTINQELTQAISVLNQVQGNVTAILAMQETVKETQLYALVAMIISAVSMFFLIVLVALQIRRRPRQNQSVPVHA